MAVGHEQAEHAGPAVISARSLGEPGIPSSGADPSPALTRPADHPAAEPGGRSEETSLPLLALLGSTVVHLGAAAVLAAGWGSETFPDPPSPAALTVELMAAASSPRSLAAEPPGPAEERLGDGGTRLAEAPARMPPLPGTVAMPTATTTERREATTTDSDAVEVHDREGAAPTDAPTPLREQSAAPVEDRESAPPSNAEQTWEARLVAKLERERRYPGRAQSAGLEDTVFVRLVLDRRGRLIEAAIRKSAGHELLDAEVLSLARRAGPYPAPPNSVTGDRIVRIVPVEFRIRRRAG